MKKYLISAAVAIAGLSAFNMQAEEPNRLLLNFPGEFNFQSYVLGNVDNISFINVPGEVRAEVEVNDVRENELTVSVKRSASCTSYLLNVVPTAMVRMYSDPTVMFKYLRSIGSHEFADDFNNGTLSGIELNPGGEYSVVTAARDSYGTDVEISHCEFTAYAPPVEGNPQVTAELVKADKFSFTIKFTPNADVLEYYTARKAKYSASMRKWVHSSAQAASLTLSSYGAWQRVVPPRTHGTIWSLAKSMRYLSCPSTRTPTTLRFKFSPAPPRIRAVPARLSSPSLPASM